MYHHPNFKHCNLYELRTNRQMIDLITRCPRQTYQAGGIKSCASLICPVKLVILVAVFPSQYNIWEFLVVTWTLKGYGTLDHEFLGKERALFSARANKTCIYACNMKTVILTVSFCMSYNVVFVLIGFIEMIFVSSWLETLCNII